MTLLKKYYHINVKIPQNYVEIIDANLAKGKALSTGGHESRAQFVRTAVKEKLQELGLLTEEYERALERRRKSNLP